tara:strand:- start:149 stop:904 length:756 start_codon:yes stop_codon:yes gene_type:complete
MTLKKIILFIVYSSFLYSCADYNVTKGKQKKERQYFSSTGFALIYDDNLYAQKVVNKKINNDEIKVMHNLLKVSTPVKIINPNNSKIVEAKISKRAEYPKIFNIVISKKIASTLELDLDNPFVEIIEVKKNKTFIAKKSNTYDEEKNVAEKVPVDEIKMDELSTNNSETKNKVFNDTNFTILINDFYYKDSAINLKNELIEKTGFTNISIKKINNNKYRLLAGPFKNFNALKTTYISLNNLGFESLNVYSE